MSWDFSSLTNAIWIAPSLPQGLPDPGRAGHSGLLDERAGPLDVGGDLLAERLRGVEPLLVAQAFPELDRHVLADQVPLEVEEVRLDVHGLDPERGVRADVDRRHASPRPGDGGPGVD